MCLPINPFKVEREWEHAGLKCAVTMNRQAGHRCGYVRIPENHPMYCENYNEIAVDVHGGLTFSKLEPCSHDDGQGWWVGFDCAHMGDAMNDPSVDVDDPTLDKITRSLLIIRRDIRKQYPVDMVFEEHYWTQAEVEAETARLAEQLAAMGVK